MNFNKADNKLTFTESSQTQYTLNQICAMVKLSETRLEEANVALKKWKELEVAAKKLGCVMEKVFPNLK